MSNVFDLFQRFFTLRHMEQEIVVLNKRIADLTEQCAILGLENAALRSDQVTLVSEKIALASELGKLRIVIEQLLQHQESAKALLEQAKAENQDLAKQLEEATESLERLRSKGIRHSGHDPYE